MERRVFLAISLSILVLYAYQAFFAPRPTPAPAAGQATPASSSVSVPGTTPAPAVEAAAAAPEPTAIVSDVSEREIVVHTSRLEVVISNRGARILHWRLKDYHDSGGRPVDLVPSDLPAAQPRPFSLKVDDPDLTRRANDRLYQVSGDNGGRLDVTSAPATLVFNYQDASGLSVSKEFQFQPDSYVTTFSAEMKNGQQTLNPMVMWGPGLGDAGALSAGGSFFTGNYVQPPAAIYHRDGKVVRLTTADAGEQPAHEGQFLFAGIDDHYFIATAIKPGQARVEYAPVSVGDANTQRNFLSFALRYDNGPKAVQYFVGPKELEGLRAVDPQLVYAINFGMFDFIVVPLLQSLKWVHGYIGNYGWAIIILTLLINLALFPLRHKSLVSMRKVQSVQPQVKAIQDRYADLKVTDPARQKMNTEIMNLYREKGANPAGGCVPMLLTMPVLFAFYSMLSQAIELRGADFGFWIHDLSVKDPYYVTPLLMGATMFWQQWLAPTTADPMQARMMMFMPVVFTVMFLGFPSGLAIYYLVTNLFQIGQQYFTNWMIGPPPVVQPARPPAERRLKNVGGSRTPGADAKK